MGGGRAADNWVVASWAGMQARGTAAALYFMAWVVIGNFVLLALFLAILISNFQARPRAGAWGRGGNDEDRPPTQEELDANPYMPTDQSETASTVGGSTLGPDPHGGAGGPLGGGGGGNALQALIVGRTDPAALYRFKKWLVLLNYHHGLNPAEIGDIEGRMDALYALEPSLFEPGAHPSVVEMDDRGEVLLDPSHQRPSAGGGGGGDGDGPADDPLRALRGKLTRLGGSRISMQRLSQRVLDFDGSSPRAGAEGGEAAGVEGGSPRGGGASGGHSAAGAGGRLSAAAQQGLGLSGLGGGLRKLFGAGVSVFAAAAAAASAAASSAAAYPLHAAAAARATRRPDLLAAPGAEEQQPSPPPLWRSSFAFATHASPPPTASRYAAAEAAAGSSRLPPPPRVDAPSFRLRPPANSAASSTALDCEADLFGTASLTRPRSSPELPSPPPPHGEPHSADRRAAWAEWAAAPGGPGRAPGPATPPPSASVDREPGSCDGPRRDSRRFGSRAFSISMPPRAQPLSASLASLELPLPPPSAPATIAVGGEVHYVTVPADADPDAGSEAGSERELQERDLGLLCGGGGAPVAESAVQRRGVDPAVVAIAAVVPAAAAVAAAALAPVRPDAAGGGAGGEVQDDVELWWRPAPPVGWGRDDVSAGGAARWPQDAAIAAAATSWHTAGLGAEAEAARRHLAHTLISGVLHGAPSSPRAASVAGGLRRRAGHAAAASSAAEDSHDAPWPRADGRGRGEGRWRGGAGRQAPPQHESALACPCVSARGLVGLPGPAAEGMPISTAALSAEGRAIMRESLLGAGAAELKPPPPEDDGRYLQHSSFLLLRPSHPLRIRLHSLVVNRWFEGAVMLLVTASSVSLALERPKSDPTSQLARGLRVLEWVISILFAVEMGLKMLLKGCFAHPGAYWRTPWDALDGAVTVTSLLALAAPSISFFRTLRLLRVLRPLRMVRRVRGMRLVVETLLSSLPAVGNVVLFGSFMFCIFAILGTQLFMGRLSRCNDSVLPDGAPVRSRDECAPGPFVCEEVDLCPELGAEAHRAWVTPLRNFDHLGRSLLTLFVVATLDSYMDTTQAVIDAVGQDRQPRYNHAPYMGLYVIAFVFLGAFFWLNLLVSVIIDYYSRLMLTQQDLMASKRAREFMKALQFTAPGRQGDAWRKVPLPSNPLRARAYGLASSPLFENFIMGVILANVLVMALPHEGSAPSFDATMSYLNAAFTFIFILEAAAKTLAMGPVLYIKDHWNKLDLFIILTSIPDLLSLVVPLGAGTGVITVFRIMRIGRMFKLIRNAKGLRALFNTLISSLPAICNVGALLFLLMYVYGVLGMHLFGGFGNPFEGSRGTNFDNIGAALIALFQVFTGDSWSAMLAQAAGCDENGYGCKSGGQALVACLFFCRSFVVLANFVMLNLVIAVVLDNFITSARNEGLLRTSDFTDVMSNVIALRVFVRLLRMKIDMLKAVDQAQQQAAAAAAAAAAATPLSPGGGGGGGGAGSVLGSKRGKSRRKRIAAAAAGGISTRGLAGMLKSGELPPPSPTTGGSSHHGRGGGGSADVSGDGAYLASNGFGFPRRRRSSGFSGRSIRVRELFRDAGPTSSGAAAGQGNGDGNGHGDGDGNGNGNGNGNGDGDGRRSGSGIAAAGGAAGPGGRSLTRQGSCESASGGGLSSSGVLTAYPRHMGLGGTELGGTELGPGLTPAGSVGAPTSVGVGPGTAPVSGGTGSGAPASPFRSSELQRSAAARDRV
ncbi:hypothetical protein GPECTOR_106g127 [Gonium pectorale]|uniref:Ion transport domain-containing protein n=1 Tax=Gonium pectorale TaxID=33097 RepID=A0A150FZI9_GONPE|nr:hypothetical protein GPECTOR_106g127 [Gonium pectorale]|eukprot:KXZ43033.1 hypothetical protein GPECTOR_106g127 [Gonium pectorale]